MIHAELVTPPQPIRSLDDAMRFLRIGGPDYWEEHPFIQSLIENAHAFCERYTGVKLGPQVWDLHLQDFCAEIEMPIWPVISVDEIAYVDTSGAQQSLDASATWIDRRAGHDRLRRRGHTAWPDVQEDGESVRIRVTAGRDPIPRQALQAADWLINHMYDRDAVTLGAAASETPLAVRDFLNQIRRYA